MGTAGIWLLLAGTLAVGVSRAQREVSIQQGPLYRTVGSHISIWCKVNGYQGPSEQNFLYSIYLPTAPEREVQIVSTEDPAFSYAIYSQRVHNGDIFVERMSGDHSLLHIRQGGAFIAPRELNVRLETDRRTYSAGETAELRCIIEAQNAADRMFAVSWVFNSSLIASVSPGGVPTLTGEYSQRESRGELRVSKESDSNFLLRIFRLRPEDSGKYNCRVMERERSASGEMTDRDIKRPKNIPITVLPLSKCQKLGTGFAVTAISRTPGVTYYDSFDLQCILKPHYPPWVGISVTWRFQPVGGGDPHELVTFSHSGGVLWGERAGNFRGRSIVEKADSSHNVRLSVSRASDSEAGKYQCVAELWRREFNGSWNRLAERASNLLEIRVQRPDINLQLDQLPRNLTVLEGNSFTVTCQVLNRTLPESRLSLEWLVWRAGESERRTLARLSTESITLPPPEEEDRGNPDLPSRLFLSQPPAGLFTLTLRTAEEQDSGAYSCHVQEWLQNPERQWYRRAEDRSAATYVSVRRPDAALRLDANPVNISVKDGDHFTLDCAILTRSRPESQLAVSWSFHGGSRSAELETILSTDRIGVWSPLSPRWEGRLQQLQPSPTSFKLRVPRATAGDSGNFTCSVQEWMLGARGDWYLLAQDEALIGWVTVQKKESDLQSAICSNDALFYLVFFYPFPIFGILIITILLVRFRSRPSGKTGEGKNGVPLLWIKEPHLNYSPTCLEPPVLSIHPGTID
uniref:Ig-like domain-containing protein n=1 Tax=Pyxicephalus adspersus TaxID=30357 RepID=A0AAV3B8U7_PYXAD|nr:TPA: hypothetical protein GDO54_002187 [Pyxicephalus adspersus]